MIEKYSLPWGIDRLSKLVSRVCFLVLPGCAKSLIRRGREYKTLRHLLSAPISAPISISILIPICVGLCLWAPEPLNPKHPPIHPDKKIYLRRTFETRARKQKRGKNEKKWEGRK